MKRLRQLMLIETEFYSRVRLDDELAERGYQVTSVKKIKDALFKMKAQIFNALIMSYDTDINTALRLLATLRRSGNSIPVILLVKRPTEEQLILLSSYAPVEVVVKPYGLADLVSRIELLCSEQDAK